MVDVGELAPDFTLRSSESQEFHLADLRGATRALLIFYPADMSSG